MVLKFPSVWRFTPPKGQVSNTTIIPRDAIQEFLGMIQKVATQGDLQEFLEHFKRFFCAANGTTHVRSSNASWAETDLLSEMNSVANNPPLFLEAFYDACQAMHKRPGDLFAPDAEMINALCSKHDIGYELEPPHLLLRDASGMVVPIPERPPTLAEKGQEVLAESLRRAEDLLEEGRGREAVQETLWLLETVTTAFRGINTGSKRVEGKYFNRIVKELRESLPGTTLNCVLEWVTSLHGYLSSPSGGGVRHGLDLNEGLELSPSEARLFCNLIRSYLSFLLTEHERLARGTRK